MDCGIAVYEHAAYLIGRRPWEVSRDGELLLEAHAEAYRTYRHAPVVVSIDIYNLEAEAYGARLREPQENGIPAVAEPVCRALEDLLAIEPFDPATAGRIAMTIDAAQRLAARFPEADVRIPLAGPMSIASSLMNLEDLLCEMAVRPADVLAALNRLVEGQVRFAKAVRHAGLDIAFFESAAAPPLLSPAMFRRVELPALKAVLARCGEVVGHPLPCIIGGDTAPILDSLLETGTRYVINPIETDQAAFMAKVASRTDVRVRINASPRILAQGTRDDIRREVDRIFRLAGDRPNVCLGTSALPYETPPENVLFVKQLCGA